MSLKLYSTIVSETLSPPHPHFNDCSYKDFGKFGSVLAIELSDFWQKRQYVVNVNKSSSEKICVHTIFILNAGSMKHKVYIRNEIKS